VEIRRIEEILDRKQNHRCWIVQEAALKMFFHWCSSGLDFGQMRLVLHHRKTELRYLTPNTIFVSTRRYFMCLSHYCWYL